jgi:purine-cytosine permease-like protein
MEISKRNRNLGLAVLFVISLIFNIKETKIINHLSKGLKFTFISIPPIAFCYFAIMVKALTEGH